MMSHGIGRYHLISFDVRHSGPLLKSYCGTIALLEFPHKCISTSEFFQKAPKGALRPFSVAALLHYVSWCALEYSVAGRISCHVPYDSTRTNVCQWLFAEIFSLTAAVSNRIDSIRNLFIIFALDFPALENPISEKMNCCIQPSSHSSHASSSSSNQSGLSS